MGMTFLLLAASLLTNTLRDPVAWSVDGDSLVAKTTGFALSGTPIGRTVRVSARIRPDECAHEDWATLGVAIHENDREFWHLALVKQPASMQSRHGFELAMMHGGHWPEQGILACRANQTKGDWSFGKDYLLELQMDSQGIDGTITEIESGKKVYWAKYAFDAPCANAGRPALHVTGALKGRVDRFVGKVADKVTPKSAPLPKGFFSVVERDGRWTALDPKGRPFTVLGVDHVHPWGMFCENLGYSPYGRHVKASYPNFEAWSDETVSRLKSWGFTALGAGCDFSRLGHRGLTHTIILTMGDRLCYGDDEWWIRQSKHAPCTAFPNVFHPDFAAACNWVARQKCTPEDGDLFGYFIDNELAWWGSGGNAEGMFNAVKALPPNHTARQALEAYVAGRTVTKELKVGFLELVADKYFAATTAAIRKYDPNHLVLGCRFAGLGGAHDVVWQTAAKYCDLVTFNCYPWADIERNVVYDRKGGRPIVECFDELYAKVKKPMLVTEWSFPALDTGRPCLHGAGQRFKTQKERVAATKLFAKTMLALPYFIGYDYFMWVDQPALGINHYFPEDSNYGLVQEDGTPHKGITEMFAKLHGNIAKWRHAPLPVVREIAPRAVVSERDKFYVTTAPSPSVTSNSLRFVRGENGWSLTNGVGLALKGCLAGGAKDAVDSVIVDGRRIGSLGVLLETELGEKVWSGARDVQSVEFTQTGNIGVVRITTRGNAKGEMFEMTLSCHIAADRQDFIAEIERIENLGNRPLPLKGLYLRPFAADKAVKEVPGVPNLWQGDALGAWEFPDGLHYGLVSCDQDVRFFHLWINPNGGQHPDAAFLPPGDVTLAPSAAYTPPRPMSARITTNL